MSKITAVQTLKRWIEDNLQALHAAQIEVIAGEYSGYGDEGNWESISFEPAEACENLDEELRDEIGELMENAYEDLAPCGYDQGDGGGGEIKLIVSSGKLFHSAYYLETERAYTEEDAEV